MEEAEIRRHLDAVEEDGYTVLENVFTPERANAFRKRISEIENTTLHPLEPGEKEEDSSFFRTAGLLSLIHI